jgi:hypothetical protein
LTQVFDLGAQTVVPGAATLPQQEKNNSAYLQRSRVTFTDCYLYSGEVALAVMCLRRVRVIGRSFAAALTHYSTVVTPPKPAAKKPAGGRCFAGEVQLARCAAELSIYYRLYALAAMDLQRY